MADASSPGAGTGAEFMVDIVFAEIEIDQVA